MKKPLLEPELDEHCRAATLHVRQPNTNFSNDNRGVLVRRLTVDEATQTVEPEKLCAHVVFLAHRRRRPFPFPSR